ncbi:MAG: hypothetical protein ACKPKO_58630, partial [Candidatus Fonsibacter sp.]
MKLSANSTLATLAGSGRLHALQLVQVLTISGSGHILAWVLLHAEVSWTWLLLERATTSAAFAGLDGPVLVCTLLEL